MSKLRKLRVLIGIKGIICLIALVAIVTAFVTYSAEVTVSPVQQFVQGNTVASWTVYVNQINENGYLPGGDSEPTLNVADSSTYAFKVTTDASKVCAIKVELATPMDTAKFSNFDITVMSWTGSAWATETLYSASTGSTTKTNINGLLPGGSGYIHQAASTTTYYIIKVTYSYDKVDSTAQNTATFVYTPLPQDSF